MGKVIVLSPFEPAVVIDHPSAVVGLDDMYRHIKCDMVDGRRLGNLPGGRYVYMWFDDEGLLNDAPANRKVGNHIIAGTIMLCADDGQGESVPFEDSEIGIILDVANLWPVLPMGTEKPEAKIEFITLG